MHCLNHYIIWSKVNNWWGLAWCCLNSLSTLFSQWDSLVNDKFQKKTWLMLFFLVLWSIWLFRNDVIFKQKTLDYDTLFFLIITRLCLWLKAIDSDFLYTASNVLRLVDGLISKNIGWLSYGLPLKPIALNGMWMDLHWESLNPQVYVVKLLRVNWKIVVKFFLSHWNLSLYMYYPFI
jgi:hypothetical protein